MGNYQQIPTLACGGVNENINEIMLRHASPQNPYTACIQIMEKGAEPATWPLDQFMAYHDRSLQPLLAHLERWDDRYHSWDWEQEYQDLVWYWLTRSMNIVANRVVASSSNARDELPTLLPWATQLMDSMMKYNALYENQYNEVQYKLAALTYGYAYQASGDAQTSQKIYDTMGKAVSRNSLSDLLPHYLERKNPAGGGQKLEVR